MVRDFANNGDIRRYCPGAVVRSRNLTQMQRVGRAVRKMIAACSDESRPAGVICGVAVGLLGLLVIVFAMVTLASVYGVRQ
ncbi:MAG: hypothetical protein ABFD54_14940 [Armatimonadota bacterium]|nr:hypothetical protein [bacterium]